MRLFKCRKSAKNLRLNLACGPDYLDGYVNIDLYPERPGIKADLKADVRALPMFKNNAVDLILASHIIEHFDLVEGFSVLREWYRILKPNGKLIIETPDLLASCKVFCEADSAQKVLMYGHLFSGRLPGDTHMFLYTEEQLVTSLRQAEFKNIKRVEPTSRYIIINLFWFHGDAEKLKSIYLRMEATK